MTVTAYGITGWIFAALAIGGAASVLAGTHSWLQNRYDFATFTRRWYCAGCQVQFRKDAPEDASGYQALGWTDEGTRVAWVLILVCGADEDDDAFWVPVTDLRPVSVPVFRPGFHGDWPFPRFHLTRQRAISGLHVARGEENGDA